MRFPEVFFVSANWRKGGVFKLGVPFPAEFDFVGVFVKSEFLW